ncbi:MAG TPA: GNAT family N-acetyltransferase [Gemmatimonadales bacterium]|nr:GNAT family N-acetyltransferase [Gemmatimonadales bacterium]
MKRQVRTTYLEMRSPGALRPSARVPPEVLLVRAAIPSPELGRFLYTAVGGAWYWRDRLVWSYRQWRDWLARPEVETWVAYERGTPAGYFELELQPEANLEITYFGLLPEFAGRGLGGYLLTQATSRAWSVAGSEGRVWVHTCTLDHPGALSNYLARGYSVFKEEEHTVELPDAPPGPWPGAERPQ